MRTIIKITDKTQEAIVNEDLIRLREILKNQCESNGCHNPKFTNQHCTRHMPI